MKRRADGAMNNSYETNPQPYKAMAKIALDFNFLHTIYRATGEKQYADKCLPLFVPCLPFPTT